MTLSPQVASARGTIAALTRSRPADDPDLIDARSELATAKIQQYVQRTLEAAPPLSPEQREHLALLFGSAA